MRLVAAALLAVTALGGLTLAVAAPAAAVTGPIAINEIESSGAHAGLRRAHQHRRHCRRHLGFQLLDSDPTHDPVMVPANTNLAVGGSSRSTRSPAFGLGSGDTVTLFAADGTTVLDTYTWTQHAATTYGRCPDGTGAFTTTASRRAAPRDDCAPAPLPPVRTDASPVARCADRGRGRRRRRARRGPERSVLRGRHP